jgi:PD-(D/E)XK nuclease superfamily
MQTLFPLIISNSDMSLLSMCELRWFRERCQHLRRPSFNIDLTAGGSFAKGIELTRNCFYNNIYFENTDIQDQDGRDIFIELPVDQTLSVKEKEDFCINIGYLHILEDMHKIMKDKEESTDVLKSPERMALALRTYFKEFPLHNAEAIPATREDGSHAIEHKMVIELPIEHPELATSLLFKAKLDMLAVENGRNWIIDEKTCKAFSDRETDLLKTSGQFIGYAWAAREKGIRIAGVKVRKIAIQIKEVKIKEFEIPITDFMIDNWYKGLLTKLNTAIINYKCLIGQAGQINIANGCDTIQDYFTPDYGLGCTAYYSPCPYSDGCTSKYGENFLKTDFQQITWESEDRKEIPLDEYRKLVGLDN